MIAGLAPPEGGFNTNSQFNNSVVQRALIDPTEYLLKVAGAELAAVVGHVVIGAGYQLGIKKAGVGIAGEDVTATGGSGGICHSGVIADIQRAARGACVAGGDGAVGSEYGYDLLIE